MQYLSLLFISVILAVFVFSWGVNLFIAFLHSDLFIFFENLMREWKQRRKNQVLREQLREIEEFPISKLLETIQDNDLLMRHKQENIPRRVKAIQVLAERGDPAAVSPLIELLRDDVPLIQQEAIEALGKLGDSGAVEPRTRVFRSPASSTIHAKAKAALQQLGVSAEDLATAKEQPEVEQPEPQQKDVQTLLVQLHHADWRIRRSALEALGDSTDPALIDPLLGCLTDTDWEVRLHAMRILQAFRNERVTEALVMMMRDTVAEVSNTAMQFTESLGTKGIDLLIPLLGATDVTVRENAVRLLGKLQDTRVVEPLLRALRDSDAQVRQLATDALLNLGAPVVEFLAKAAESPDAKTRWKAVDAMQRLQDEQMIEALVGVLADSEADIREIAAHTLYALNWQPQTSEERIAYHIAQADWEALRSFGAQAIPPLLRHIHEKDVRIRRYIHETLSFACTKVNAVVFGEDVAQSENRQSELHNIDTATLSLPFSKLQYIRIFTETYDFHLTERFVTYAINVLGEKFLKKHVSVDILGDVEKLHPNLLNTFKHLCKSVTTT
jgi:HEAT repeat protein